MSSTIQYYEQTRHRIYYLDVLRWIATIAVIMLHVSGNFYVEYNNSIGWCSSVVYSSITRWCVPIFVMISGAVFLNENIAVSLKKLYGKHILRILLALIVWQLLYSFALSPIADYIHARLAGISYNYAPHSLYPLIYHLWFLPMIIGLYVMVPVLRAIVQGKQVIYFLIFSFAVNVLQWLTTLHIPHMGIINTIFQDTYLTAFVGYSGYYVLGWYLSTIQLTPRIYKISRIVFWASTLLTIVAMAMLRGDGLFQYMAPNVMLMSGSFFICMRYRLSEQSKECRWGKIVFNTQKELFGIYLVHAFYVALFCALYPISTVNLLPIVVIPLASLVIFALSWGTIRVLRYIPFVKHIS